MSRKILKKMIDIEMWKRYCFRNVYIHRRDPFGSTLGHPKDPRARAIRIPIYYMVNKLLTVIEMRESGIRVPLSKEERKEIAAMKRAGATYWEITKRFQVSRQTIYIALIKERAF